MPVISVVVEWGRVTYQPRPILYVDEGQSKLVVYKGPTRDCEVHTYIFLVEYGF